MRAARTWKFVIKKIKIRKQSNKTGWIEAFQLAKKTAKKLDTLERIHSWTTHKNTIQNNTLENLRGIAWWNYFFFVGRLFFRLMSFRSIDGYCAVHQPVYIAVVWVTSVNPPSPKKPFLPKRVESHFIFTKVRNWMLKGEAIEKEKNKFYCALTWCVCVCVFQYLLDLHI